MERKDNPYCMIRFAKVKSFLYRILFIELFAQELNIQCFLFSVFQFCVDIIGNKPFGLQRGEIEEGSRLTIQSRFLLVPTKTSAAN